LEKAGNIYVYPGSIHIYSHTRLKEITRVAEAYADRISVSRMLLYVSALIDTSFGDARSYVKEDGSMQFAPKRLTGQQKVVSSGTLCACNRIDVFPNNTIYYRSEYKGA
jgi:hypothetical protein